MSVTVKPPGRTGRGVRHRAGRGFAPETAGAVLVFAGPPTAGAAVPTTALPTTAVPRPAVPGPWGPERGSCP